MKASMYWPILMIVVIMLHVSNVKSADISGDLTKWHKVTLSFTGPLTNELATPNPFTDYRLDVTFTGPSDQVYEVPGYFAADGNAAETSADSGSVWRVNFCPDEIGSWDYSVSFVTAKNTAAKLTGGTSAGYFDGETGSFSVSENLNTDEKDFRNKGKLLYVDDHYLQFQETGEYFIKAGANSPEVFLEYAEFDNTPSSRLYPDHIADWNDGDPIWQTDKGQGIIGVVNYLSSIDVNVFYFLTMNAYGDGKKAWPWIHQDSIVRYDCSKLDQWDIVFEYMNAMGIMVHFVLTETENESYFEVVEDGEPGGFANSRKIYYREMVARYGYLPAITWNIGEENGWDHASPYQAAMTDEQRKDACDRMRELTYFNDHISIHNGPSWDDSIFEPLLDHPSFTGPAFQWDHSKDIYKKILEWRNKSNDSGHKWVVSLDEAYVNPELIEINTWRKENVWPTYMAGGAGVEFYIGAGKDLTIEEFRKYEQHYNSMTIASNFLKTSVEIQEFVPDTTVAENGWTLRNNDSIYLIYFGNASGNLINVPANTYQIEWFNPRTGGLLEKGTTHSVKGGLETNVGAPPSESGSDWLCKLVKVAPFEAELEVVGAPEGRSFDEGNADLSQFDTVLIKNIGGASLDMLSFVISEPSLLDVKLTWHTDSLQEFQLSLKEAVNDLAAGDYFVTIGFNSDSAASATIEYKLEVIFVPDAIKQTNQLNDLDLKVRTNIINSVLEFVGEHPKQTLVRIYNLNGVQVYSNSYPVISNTQIEINSLKQGSYIVRLESESGISVFRFVKL